MIDDLIERLTGEEVCGDCGYCTNAARAVVRIEALQARAIAAEAEAAALRDALDSIARNTCCNGCGEAALVARAALAKEA